MNAAAPRHAQCCVAVHMCARVCVRVLAPDPQHYIIIRSSRNKFGVCVRACVNECMELCVCATVGARGM